MKKSRRMLTWARRIALFALLLAFATSCFTVLSILKGTPGEFSSTQVLHVNGIIAYVDLLPKSGRKEGAIWRRNFAWTSEMERRGVTYRGVFQWKTLGFRLTREDQPQSGSRPACTFTFVGVPYWPLILILLFPELRLWLKVARARAIRNMPVARVGPSEVANDLLCVHCGYNLRTQPSEGRCPECGSPVIDTLTLNTELARSRPGWLRGLAAGNVMLLLARVLLLIVYASAFWGDSMRYHNYQLAGASAIAACVLYLAGIFLLTIREHPFLRSPDRKSAILQRILAPAIVICIGIAVYHQTYKPPTGSWRISLFEPALKLSGAGFWHFPALVLFITGWLLYCICVVFEYHFLAKLSGRLLDRFMTEHCIIAGIGASVSSLLVLFIVPAIHNWNRIPQNIAGFTAVAAVLVLWALFPIWAGFMNVYSAIRFLQQSWMAAELWRGREGGGMSKENSLRSDFAGRVSNFD